MKCIKLNENEYCCFIKQTGGDLGGYVEEIGLFEIADCFVVTPRCGCVTGRRVSYQKLVKISLQHDQLG